MEFQRLTIRSIDVSSLKRLRHLRRVTRLPLGALVENAIDELWDWYARNGWHLDEPSASDESGSRTERPQTPMGRVSNEDRAQA